MSGHNKWSKIKNVKAKTDAVKGRAFSKAAMNIIMAVKTGGSDDPNGNVSLRVAIDAAKKINMPNDNIKRAIERGAGRGGAGQIEQVTYEGYGPGGVALYIECMTDNRNRTSSVIRSALEKNGGNMGEPGSVGYMFHKKGYLEFDSTQVTEEKLMEVLIDAGAEDIVDNGDGTISVSCEAAQLSKCIAAAEKAKIPLSKAEDTMDPSVTVPLNEDVARKVLNLIDALDDLDDVQKVHANFDIPDEVLEKIAG